jgi:RNA polymerase sigma-70 factor (ECF subfamily)
MGEDDGDDVWVQQSRQGDSAAFESLVRKHQRMIHSLTYRMTGSLSDAEDLAQEAFIRAFRQLDSYHGTAKFSTWLYRIAVNACLNWRQREGRRDEIHTRWSESNEALRSEPAPQADGPAPANEIQSALMKLPARQRAAIVLTVFDGLNHAQAAKILGCSETTVSWRIFTARRKLRTLLSRKGGQNE